ncbi:hypothetical protein CF70_024700 [Cupriavidus sp. SK-3]|uniref:hypothetical protein n=1 Tax=Cupriavidus sp. SK-3 TaxID=1470558 RepID=UPI0004475530|nr:hypothetical protein [Cupriavidus sp. SK-3]KDP83509.1 hypothetical protein CF70_024700 [Cupriavidus sp. SK-3]
MPIDFQRVPPRATVPDLPRPSAAWWTFLFVAIVGGGSAFVIYLWPATKPTNTVWFWLCVIGYPLAAWAFLLSVAMAGAYARRSDAMAVNRASDAEEQDCHVRASKPLAILAHAWCFSADDAENGVEGVASGRMQMAARPSAAYPETGAIARWIAIPEKPFYPGNELSEHARHKVVTDWLLDRLLRPVIASLESLPVHTRLRVRLVSASSVEADEVSARLEAKILACLPQLPVATTDDTDHLSLFDVDTWADRMPADEVQLLVALQLRRAISERLDAGVAEAGVALLVGRPGASRHGSVLHLHRPAKGSAQSASDAVALAMRWGRTSAEGIGAVWDQALSDEVVTHLRSSSPLGDAVTWVDLAKTIGNSGSAGAWLATVLAAENAALSARSQLVLTQEGDRCIALVCRKPS